MKKVPHRGEGKRRGHLKFGGRIRVIWVLVWMQLLGDIVKK